MGHRKFLYLSLLFFLCVQSIELYAQRSKKSKIIDEIGVIAGLNIVLFYPKDVNRNLINGGNPKLVPTTMMGLSYRHAFSPRLAHIFQLRLADHQIKYWKISSQTWHVNHERVTVKSDSGDYHIKYSEFAMNYMIGWNLNKKIGWHFYTGIQWDFTVSNRSTKTVDRIEFGVLDGFDFVPHDEPLFFDNETSKTYSPDAAGEILFRTDLQIKINTQWTIRPVMEFGFDPGHVQVSIKDRLAFYLEVYKKI